MEKLTKHRFPLLITGTIFIGILPVILISSGVSFNYFNTQSSHLSYEEAFRALQGSFLHTILEWSSVTLGVVTLIVVIIHYYIRFMLISFFLGIIAFVASLMDMFHILTANKQFGHCSNEANSAPFTWTITRIFNSFALVLLLSIGVYFMKIKKKHVLTREVSNTKRILILIVGTIGLFFGCVIVAIACIIEPYLPNTLAPNNFIHRPFDLIALTLFTVALILFLYMYKHKKLHLLQFLICATILDIFIQGYMVFGSSVLFDSYFNVAHFYKVLANLIPLIGWLYDISINVQQERDAAKLMLGYVNHEIRNPLNGIKGILTITIDELENRESSPLNFDCIVSNLKTANGSCNLISHIVDDILDIRKLEEGKVDVRYSLVNIDSIVEELRRTIQPKLDENIDVDYVTDIQSCTVKCDRHRLLQILLNFLSNAIKFTIEGTITLRITQDFKHTLFQVIDTGRGIPEEKQYKIFSPFMQTKRSDTTRKGGTGLGLYLCKMLATLLNGQVGFSSVENQGSTFFVKIPNNNRMVLEQNSSIALEDMV